MVKFKDFSRLLSDFPVLFQADLIFKDFSFEHPKQMLQLMDKINLSNFMLIISFT